MRTICNASGFKKVTYPGINNYSQLIYDVFDQCVDIVETRSGAVTSTKQFVWCGNARCEARDVTGAITAQLFPGGQTITGSNYYYSKDHMGSIREMTDASGNVQVGYKYDPYGRVVQLQGSLASDFQYAGYYVHAPSGLNLTMHRAYDANLGRWINRDPIGESGGINLYAYVNNSTINLTDPYGTDGKDPNYPNCITDFKECAKWCDDTSMAISDPVARAAWTLGCRQRCFKRFQPKQPKPTEGPLPWPKLPPYNNYVPPIVPIPLPIPIPIPIPVEPIPVPIVLPVPFPIPLPPINGYQPVVIVTPILI